MEIIKHQKDNYFAIKIFYLLKVTFFLENVLSIKPIIIDFYIKDLEHINSGEYFYCLPSSENIILCLTT